MLRLNIEYRSGNRIPTGVNNTVPQLGVSLALPTLILLLDY